MKKLIYILTLFMVASFAYGQEQNEIESYGVEQYVEKCRDFPVIRKINGGTVFNISYEGAWNNDMKGAFEYACKLWEEALPNCLPINITAKIGNIRGSSSAKLLSKVTYKVYNDKKFETWSRESILSSRIKGVLMKEYTCGAFRQFVDSITDSSFFEKPDIVLVYNKNNLDDFSFSLNANSVDKYDFVTLVLRDIAKALGFSTNFTVDTFKKKINFTGKKTTPMETIVSKVLGGDPYVAYEKATNNKLDIYIPELGTCSLYAPAVWNNGVSLNSFLPDSSKKITELLTYNFGRGTVYRDIQDYDYLNIFDKFLHWDNGSLTVGPAVARSEGTGSTENIIKNKGNSTISDNTSLNSLSLWQPSSNAVATQQLDNNELYQFFAPYNFLLSNNGSNVGWKIAILRKNGLWDVVYENSNTYANTLNVNLGELAFHYKMDDYARTVDGYLRCRVVRSKEEYDNLYHRIYYSVRVRYYVLDYIPQKIVMNYAGIYSDNSIVAYSGDAYTDDIKVCMKNLEGTNRVIVEQYDEGNDMPMRYNVKDFKKGYFIATVDKELYTRFKVIAINDNGQTASDVIEVPPTDPESIDVLVSNNSIDLFSQRESKLKQIVTSYEIFQLGSVLKKVDCGKVVGKSIELSKCKKGSFVINLFDSKHNKRKTISFVRK